MRSSRPRVVYQSRARGVSRAGSRARDRARLPSRVFSLPSPPSPPTARARDGFNYCCDNCCGNAYGYFYDWCRYTLHHYLYCSYIDSYYCFSYKP